MVGLNLANECGIALVHNLVQSGVAEDGKPQKGKDGRHQHYTHHKLTDRAAATDLGHEQPDKRCPGDGPAKNKQGPVADPVTAGIGLQVKSAFDNKVQVAAGVLQEALENMDGWPGNKHKQHQGNGQHHVYNGQAFYPLVHARHDRDDGQTGDQSDADNLHRRAYWNARPQIVQPRIDLRHGQAKGGGDTKQGAEDGEYIDRMPDRAVDPVADQRVQG